MVPCVSASPARGSGCAHLGARGGVKSAVPVLVLMLLDSEWGSAFASGPGEQLDTLKSL